MDLTAEQLADVRRHLDDAERWLCLPPSKFAVPALLDMADECLRLRDADARFEAMSNQVTRINDDRDRLGREIEQLQTENAALRKRVADLEKMYRHA